VLHRLSYSGATPVQHAELREHRAHVVKGGKMATRPITELELKKLKPGERLTDALIKGFSARCLPSGEISFGFQYTVKESGKRRWMGIGLHGSVTVKEARDLAKQYAGQVAARHDPAREEKTAKARSENTVNHVLDRWIIAHVANLRTAVNVKAGLANHVRPVIGDKCIYDLRRADIINLKEKIAERYPRMAELQIGYLRSAFVWWQKRDEDFNSPVVEGMNESQRKARNRVLTSEEIVDLWRALDELEGVPECFAAYVKVLFLSTCRRCEVSQMHTSELECGNQHAMIGGASTKTATSWTIPGSRYKTKVDHQLPLIPAIKKLLPGCENGFVFVSGKKPIKDFNHPKAKLDAKIAEIRKREKRPPMPAWVFHDLRRTARSIMAATGVQRDVAERVLGHVIPGVEGVYNRWQYHTEKADALTRLANFIDGIVHSRPPNVVPMQKRTKRAASDL